MSATAAPLTPPADAVRALAGVRPPRVRLARVFLTCGLVLGAEIVLMLLVGRDWHEALVPGYAILTLAFAAVFVLGAVTVAGFVAGAAGAGLVVLHLAGLPLVLGAAAGVALLCGVSPGWARVEAWQAARAQALTAGEEAAIARRAPRIAGGRHRVRGPRLRAGWRSDRVIAAFLVLAFPPAVAAFGLWFVDWVSSR
jgi:hypothetical protein